MSRHSAARISSATVITSPASDEAHLDVELGELRLAVGAEVFVAITARDLVVTLHSGHHEQLLEQLRALGKRVEGAGLKPSRHQEVTSPFRGGAGQRRGLDLDEVVVGQHSAGCGIRPRPQSEGVARPSLTTQVQVPVL